MTGSLGRFLALILLSGWCVFLILPAESTAAEKIDGLIKDLRSKDEQTQLAAA
jgi:hypothetical protein